MNNLKKFYFVVGAIILIFFIIGITQRETKDEIITNTSAEKKLRQSQKARTFEESNTTDDNANTESEEDNATFEYKTRLNHGYYYSGINIPQGIYNVKWISGSGSITFDDEPGFGISLGKGKNNIKKYKNLDLSSFCSYLEVTDTLNIEIECKNAAYAYNDIYKNEASKTVILESGKYETGVDISPGIYDVTCLKGSGNFQTDDEINVLLSTKNRYSILGSYYVKKVKHIKLKEGEVVNLKGLKAKFVPSKIKLEKNFLKQ